MFRRLFWGADAAVGPAVLEPLDVRSGRRSLYRVQGVTHRCAVGAGTGATGSAGAGHGAGAGAAEQGCQAGPARSLGRPPHPPRPSAPPGAPPLTLLCILQSFPVKLLVTKLYGSHSLKRACRPTRGSQALPWGVWHYWETAVARGGGGG